MNESTLASEIKPMVAATPAPRKLGGQKGGSLKTIARRQQLQANPGQWFLWKTDAKSGGDTGQALRTLLGSISIKGIDRKSLPYESTARLNENRKWDIYVRYVGEYRQYA
jgi:hypothetical protein